MNIHLVSDTTLFLEMGGIDSVGYQLEPPPPAMLVFQAGGGVLTYPVTEIDSITYSPGGPEGTPQVATLPPVSVGSVGAICRVAVGSNGASPVVERGVCYGTTELPEVGGSSVLASSTAGSFQVQLAGLQPGVTYFARAFATNAEGTAYGNQVSFTTVFASYLNPSITYGSMTDQEGNSYATVVIGTQEWMAENLRSSTYANGDTIPKVANANQWTQLTTGAWVHYGNNSNYDIPRGKLYNWYTIADPRNVCPTGWRVPTDAEWTVLTDYLGGMSVAGGKMKSTGTEIWIAPNGGATNESGFSGLPGGFRSSIDGTYGYINGNAWWWSASEAGEDIAWIRNVSIYFETIDRGAFNLNNGISVRCLRD